ncbi:response regulator [Desulforamulus aquiferis]|uniref:Stage 0 sporulation protein A homolog n=1 Tax=Desulforamulus aquiferis TaxID=1397668 RepID=A0AAW7ZGW6_9FIRM|nr:response regulator [Desulforamulus aquiferis]MDO7788271.1 response regulator [Desulforamulus aquiferis]
MKPLRIVVVDDEVLIRMDLKEILTELGHKVVGEAGNGEAALDLIQRIKPDMAILDVKMEKIDGIKVAKLIVGQKICAVLLLTAYNEEELIRRAMDAGVVGYLTKPITEKELEPALQLGYARYQEILDLKQKKVVLKKALDMSICKEKLKNIQ